MVLVIDMNQLMNNYIINQGKGQFNCIEVDDDFIGFATASKALSRRLNTGPLFLRACSRDIPGFDCHNRSPQIWGDRFSRIILSA